MDNFWLWIVGVVMCLPVYDTVVSMYQSVFRKETALARNISLATRIVVSVALLMLSISLLVGATNNAFIYTRF